MSDERKLHKLFFKASSQCCVTAERLILGFCTSNPRHLGSGPEVSGLKLDVANWFFSQESKKKGS